MSEKKLSTVAIKVLKPSIYTIDFGSVKSLSKLQEESGTSSEPAVELLNLNWSSPIKGNHYNDYGVGLSASDYYRIMPDDEFGYYFVTEEDYQANSGTVYYLNAKHYFTNALYNYKYAGSTAGKLKAPDSYRSLSRNKSCEIPEKILAFTVWQIRDRVNLGNDVWTRSDPNTEGYVWTSTLSRKNQYGTYMWAVDAIYSIYPWNSGYCDVDTTQYAGVIATTSYEVSKIHD